MTNSVCVISFSPVSRDSRVLRQINYLSPHYDLSVIGYGSAHPSWKSMQVNWMPVVRTKMASPLKAIFLLLGRLCSGAYDFWYWGKLYHVHALEAASLGQYDIIHANDWEALPIAVEASRKNGARVVFDAHEYSPLQFEEDYWRSKLLAPAVRYLLQKYDSFVDASITVAPLIAEKYKQEFDLKPIVVLNVPESVEIQRRDIDPNCIRLIHHGVAMRNRRLETMIEALAMCDQRYRLHFMLIDHDSGYIQELEDLASRLCPGRVTFGDPVTPAKVVQQISQYDVGFYLLEPSNYNNKVALPNKFFDFIAAGLVICIGPSPSMADIIHQYGCGCVTASFAPRDVARALNRVTPDQWVNMQRAAREAAKRFSAGTEMGKMVDLYRELLA